MGAHSEWTLTVRGPNSPPKTLSLPKDRALAIGRAVDNDVVLGSEAVSRRHAQIVVTDEGLRVLDLGSRNGTLLNGRALGAVPRTVRPGDVLCVGEYKIKIDGDRSSSSRHTPDGFVTLMSGPLSRNPYLAPRASGATPPPLPQGADAAGPPDTAHARVLYRFAELLASAPPRERVQGSVLDAAIETTGFEEAVLLLGRRGGLEVACERGCSGDPRWSRTIVNEATRRRAALLVRHLPSDPRFNAVHSVVLAGCLRVLCVPLVSGSATIGALYLATRQSELPGENAVQVATALGQLAATALHRPAGVSREHSVTMRKISDQARFARGAFLEVSRLLQAYREALATPGGVTEERLAALRALEEEIGIAELSEEAPRALEELYTSTELLELPEDPNASRH